MANNVAVFTWPAANTTAVAQTQNTAGAGSLILNGSLTQLPNNPLIPVFGDISRTVSFTSAGNNSGVAITIVGTYKGAVQSEVILAGPSGDTIYSADIYDSVTSITVSGAVTAMSAGSGTTGQTQWYQYDTYRPYPSMSVQVVVTGTINYSFQSTLDDVVVTASPFVNVGLVIPNPGNADAYQTVMSSQATSQFAYFSYPVRYCNVIINSATTGSLVAKFCQQGIR